MAEREREREREDTNTESMRHIHTRSTRIFILWCFGALHYTHSASHSDLTIKEIGDNRRLRSRNNAVLPLQ